MKVAIVSRSWFTETRGGAERYIYELVNGLINLGHEIVTVSRQNSDLKNEHIRVWSPSVSILGSAIFSLLGARKIRKHEASVAVINQYWAEMASLYLDVPSIIILHDVGLFDSAIAQESRVKHFLRQRILRRVVRKAARIIVPSRLTYEGILHNLSVPREKISMIPEGVDLHRFKPTDREPSDSIILCTGRFSPNKGHLLLIEAFKELSRRSGWRGELYLVGYLAEREREYFDKMKSLADDRIKVVTDVTDEELAGFYQNADVCVFPSVSDEGWGLTVVEAFASGVPVVCSDIFEETGVATTERALMFPRGDVEGLTEAIETMILNPELRKRLALRGLIYAQTLSWEKMVEAIEGIIYEVGSG
jgi:glycosyltransferase involved in cell wall biosynthesis